MHSKSQIMSDYCSSLAQENNLKFYLEDFDYKKFNNKNIEAKARTFRYEKLTDICTKNKINYVLTAHHQDDQIETIYMAENKNSSWVSKIGIRSKFDLYNKNNMKVCLIRPMLDIPKNEIIQYSKKNSIDYFDDPTNIDVKFLRNKVRFKIKSKINNSKFRLKYLEISKLNKQKIQKISNDIKCDFYDLVAHLKANDVCILNKDLLIERNYDFIFLFFKKILKEYFDFDDNVSSEKWKNLHIFLKSSRTGNSFELNEYLCVTKTRNYIYLYSKAASLDENKIVDCGNYFFRLGTISVSKSDIFVDFKKNEGICIPFNFIDSLEINKWRYGDKCLSHNGSTIKVSDIFINNKLSLFHKQNYPILKYSGKIIWIPNLYSFDNYSIKNNKEFFVLRWSINI
tara:strand:+ start:6040 stop:7233 length:1194 start_codon:yes stop_codon:yes gene_type:complete